MPSTTFKNEKCCLKTSRALYRKFIDGNPATLAKILSPLTTGRRHQAVTAS